MSYIIVEECGSEIPALAYAHNTRPEQSNPTLGSAEPHTYCVPITDSAAAMAI
jgi:hypothetical protein